MLSVRVAETSDEHADALSEPGWEYNVEVNLKVDDPGKALESAGVCKTANQITYRAGRRICGMSASLGSRTRRTRRPAA